MAKGGRTVGQVPALVLRELSRLPSCCAPHGLPAADRISMPIPSPTRHSRFREAGAGALGMVAGAARTAATLRVVPVTNWPVCTRCLRRRRALRIVTRLMFWGGLVAFLGGFAIPVAIGQVGQANPALLVPILGGLALMLLSAVALALGQPARIARVRATPDGAAVQFIDPHPEFVRQMRAVAGAHWS